jgi:hypothetical protein
MAKLSIVIPSREERFLVPTIDDIFRNARGETEVIAVLDSDKWPDKWDEVVSRHAPRLHTIHNGASKGMRHSINVGFGSAKSRGAKYIAKSDGHIAFGEGFDEILLSEIEDNWLVIPRRLRLEPETWTIAEPEKLPHDYHYLSFPDDPNDFGGAGLNGKPWIERTKERLDKPEYLIDDEMSSQGSFWLTSVANYERLEFMDEASYGPFWNEMQECANKCWLSGGRVVVNKKTYYAHLHKGKKYGRGYRMDESWLKQGRNHTMKWIWNEAWDKQTLPFEWLIDHFWPVPGWPENWREVLYAGRRPQSVAVVGDSSGAGDDSNRGLAVSDVSLKIHTARYGVHEFDPTQWIDVTARLQSLVVNDSLDIVVNNSTLAPGKNPFRGQKKQLTVAYSYDSGDVVTVMREEKEALIIGRPRQRQPVSAYIGPIEEIVAKIEGPKQVVSHIVVEGKQIFPTTAPALNDFLVRRFNVSPYRLRAPMPIEIPDFHRNDLAQLFAELGFRRGAEIGVAEGNYSEVLLKANPECELLLVDPWHAYSDNPQNKSEEKHSYAFNEMMRKTDGYEGRRVQMMTSMKAVQNVEGSSLDFCYIDGHHSFDYVMQDLIQWSKRVRSGGIVSGDDLIRLDEKRWGAGPIEAVNAYVSAHRIPIWFTFAGHKSWDFMFVKP